MRNILIISALALFAFGCSSTPKEENSVVDLAPGTPSPPTETTLPPRVEEARPATPTSREQLNTSKNVLREAIKSGQQENIFRSASVVLSQSPNDVMALNAMGFYYYQRSGFAAAEYFFKKALQTEPNNSMLHNNLGIVQLAIKEDRDAIRSFRKSIELDSRNTTAAANIGSIYIQKHDYDKAVVALEMAYPRFRKDVRVVSNYAVALAATGKDRRAQDVYKEAMALSPNNKDIMFNYSILLIDKLKNFSEGLELINKIRFLGPTADMRNKINDLETKAKSGL